MNYLWASMGIIFLILIASVAAIYLFMHNPSFGAAASGHELKKIHQSSSFRNGQFQNLSPTPSLSENASFFKVFKKFFLEKHDRKRPESPIPSVKTDLLNLDAGKNILVWFGHSSYFIQLNDKTILVDPVFSGNASPLNFTTRSFEGTDIYQVEDLPKIDYLFLTHDHWDHLDYRTLLKLKPKVNKIITGLGVGTHLKRWGYDQALITELDWDQQKNLDEGFIVNAMPARHFSGRGFKRNGTLWSSYVLTAGKEKIFIGGDSGYDQHFAEIGDRFGPFQLVILENGQYNSDWKYIHMNPEETVQAAIDLRATKLLPVHWAKFALSMHPWDEPILRITKEAAIRNVNLLHPRIGEAVDLDQNKAFDCWWEGIS